MITRKVVKLGTVVENIDESDAPSMSLLANEINLLEEQLTHIESNFVYDSIRLIIDALEEAKKGNIVVKTTVEVAPMDDLKYKCESRKY